MPEDGMRFAYADPPYLRSGHYYKKIHPRALDWNKIETHAALIQRLGSYDGWALSLHSPSLKNILPLCPPEARVMAWIKPFCSFKPGVNPAYAWEPVIVKLARPRTRKQETVRDWLSANITLKKGLAGAKPMEFAYWLFKVLNLDPRIDTLDDLFPGTGAIKQRWKRYVARHG